MSLTGVPLLLFYFTCVLFYSLSITVDCYKGLLIPAFAYFLFPLCIFSSFVLNNFFSLVCTARVAFPVCLEPTPFSFVFFTLPLARSLHQLSALLIGPARDLRCRTCSYIESNFSVLRVLIALMMEAVKSSVTCASIYVHEETSQKTAERDF